MNNKPITPNTDLDNNQISLAGEFAVLSQLALRGFDANMTLGRTKGVDILVFDPKMNRMLKIEVKTHYRYPPANSTLFGHTLDWIMSEKHETIIAPDLFYCFVNIGTETHNFRFFIIPSAVVAKYVKEQHIHWLSAIREKTVQDTSLRRFRIGLDKEGYKINTPLAVNFEDKWDFSF